MAAKSFADAGSFDELQSRLAQMGIEPKHTLIVQAGAEYPETATIFASNRDL
jgi:hypothetical protein